MFDVYRCYRGTPGKPSIPSDTAKTAQKFPRSVGNVLNFLDVHPFCGQFTSYKQLRNGFNSPSFSFACLSNLAVMS